MSTIEHVIGREVLDSAGIRRSRLRFCSIRVPEAAPSRPLELQPASAKRSNYATAVSALVEGRAQRGRTCQRRDRRDDSLVWTPSISGPLTSP